MYSYSYIKVEGTLRYIITIILNTAAITLSLSVDPSASSLTVSWRLSDGMAATTYTISYYKKSFTCFNESGSGITTSQTQYRLTGLEEDVEYSVTVTASLSGGAKLLNVACFTTLTAG